jgi:hypothetical protein
MCTLLTIDSQFWFINKAAVIGQIYVDAEYNKDGWSILGVDSDSPGNDVLLSSMKLSTIIVVISSFFDHGSTRARIFLHARAATTRDIGIAYNHAFTDAKGTFIMHNGVVNNANGLSVDSFNIGRIMPSYDEELYDYLLERGESFANIFLITPDLETYSVLRMKVGSLYTDRHGNYSTNPIAEINETVGMFSRNTHCLGDEYKAAYPQYLSLGDWK